MVEDVYALDADNAAKLGGAVRRVQQETRESYNVTPLDGFACRGPDNAGITVKVTGVLGNSGAGYGLHAAVLQVPDTTAYPPYWEDGAVVWVLPAPGETHSVGDMIGSARFSGVASDGVPVFTGGAVGAGGSVLLVEVTGYDGGTHRHTVKRKTWTATDVVDYSPLTAYTTCVTSSHLIAGAAVNYELPYGTLCWMTPIPDAAGLYWIEPIGDYASDSTPGTMSTYAQHFIGRKRFRSRTEIAYDALTSGYVGTPVPDMEPAVFATVFQVTKAITILDCGTRTTGNVFVGPYHPLTTALPFAANVFAFASHGLRSDGIVLAQLACGYQQDLGSLVTNAACFHTVAAQETRQIGSGTYSLRPQVVFATPGLESLHNAGITLTSSVTVAPDYAASTGQMDGPSFLTSGVFRFFARGFGICSEGGFVYGPDGSIVGVGPSAAGVILGGTELVRLYTATDGGGGTIYAEFIGGLFIRLKRLGGNNNPNPDFDPGVIAAGTGPTTLKAGRTYYADSTSGAAEFYLPLLSAPGDRFRLVGRAAGGWRINQRAGQTIRTANAATTTGTGGNLAGPQWMSVEIECLNAGTDFVIVGGNSPIANGPVSSPIIWT